MSGEELLRSTGDCGVAAQPKPVERAENFQFHIAKARAVQPRPHGVEHTADVPHAWDADVEECLRHVRQREARGAGTKVPATQPVEIDARAEEVAAVDLILGRIADRGGCCALHSRQDLLPGPPRKPAAYRVHLSRLLGRRRLRIALEAVRENRAPVAHCKRGECLDEAPGRTVHH